MLGESNIDNVNYTRLAEECGVVGVFMKEKAVTIAIDSLQQLQHRGQETAGIASLDKLNNKINSYKNLGLVSQVFTSEEAKKKLIQIQSNIVIGHVRYSTSGKKQSENVENAQPFVFQYQNISYAISHNGNIVNANSIKEKLLAKNYHFLTESDSEVIGILIQDYLTQQYKLDVAIEKTMQELIGGYAILIIDSQENIFAIRDVNGIRPLSFAQADTGVIFASETCVYNLFEVQNIQDVKAGELIKIDKKNKLSSKFLKNTQTEKLCLFEFLYFARPYSNMHGEYIYNIRKEIGRALAKENKIDADLVVPVLNSGNIFALGYAQESNIAYEPILMVNPYIGRSFIAPTQQMRNNVAKYKHHAIKNVIKGKKIIVVDDSMVRGTTIKRIIELLWKCRVKEIHLVLATPQIVSPCYYGIDIPDTKHLISAQYTIEEIKQYINATSLYFISLDGVQNAIRKVTNKNKSQFCNACMSGNYITEIVKNTKK